MPVIRTRHLLAASALVAASLSAPAIAAESPEPGRIHVTASGHVEVAPDKATLSARLWEQTPFVEADQPEKQDPADMRKAREALEERVGELILSLEEMGIESRRIEAGSLTIRNTQNHQRLDNGDHQRMVATRVERPIEVTLHDTELVPEVLTTLTRAGVNHLSGVGYGVKDMDAARRDALADALSNAREEALVIASGLDVELGRVIEVTRGQGNSRPPQSMPMARMSLAESADAGASQNSEYRAGETTVNATVSVSWEIADQ